MYGGRQVVPAYLAHYDFFQLNVIVVTMSSQHLTRIESAGFSASFTDALRQHGFFTIGELLAIPVADLVQHDWFQPEMLDELCDYIKKNKGAG